MRRGRRTRGGTCTAAPDIPSIRCKVCCVTSGREASKACSSVLPASAANKVACRAPRSTKLSTSFTLSNRSKAIDKTSSKALFLGALSGTDAYQEAHSLPSCTISANLRCTHYRRLPECGQPINCKRRCICFNGFIRCLQVNCINKCAHCARERALVRGHALFHKFGHVGPRQTGITKI
jgi:hypothetical protein